MKVQTLALMLLLLGCNATDGADTGDSGSAAASSVESTDQSATTSSVQVSAAASEGETLTQPAMAASPLPEETEPQQAQQAQPASLLQGNFPDEVPVFPGAVGFGTMTPAGSGRHLDNPYSTVHKVTNLHSSGPGSLRACIDASGPRVCVFEVSGTIDMTGRVNVYNPYLTIAGQTAPSPGILIRGVTLTIRTHDVLIQHVRIRTGDDAHGHDPDNRDSIAIISDNANVVAENIVLDHVSVSWGIDEVVFTDDRARNITISNTIISEGLSNSLHHKGEHSKGLLMESPNTTLYRNLFMSIIDRSPMDRSPSSVQVNNVIYNAEKGSRIEKLSDTSVHDGLVRKSSMTGIVRILGPDNHPDPVNDLLFKIKENLTGTQLYIENNECARYSNPDWPCVNYSSAFKAGFRVSSPPIWNDGIEEIALGDVEDHISGHVGAWPASRDSVDQRLMAELDNRSGYVPDCISPADCVRHAGGWPFITENTRALSVPANPNEVLPSGYTRLEEWLFSFYDQAE